VYTPRILALLAALVSLIPSAASQEPVACDRTCTADVYVDIGPNSQWTISSSSTDGAGTQTCETCENCKGTLTYLFWPSNPNRAWHLENDPGLAGHSSTPQDGTGMTYGSINMSSGCDDGVPHTVIGTALDSQGVPTDGFTAYLYCQC
jgi:hypothetical protein